MFGAFAGRSRQWVRFWLVVMLVAVLCAFGRTTPFYPALQALVPALKTFRYPAKYIIFFVFGLSALAVAAWDAFEARDRTGADPAGWRIAWRATVGGAAVLALLAYLASASTQYFGTMIAKVFVAAAAWVGIDDATNAVVYLMLAVPGAANRVMLLAGAVAFLTWIAASKRREATVACFALFVCVVADPAIQALSVNPTMDATYVQAPTWSSALARYPHSRVYVGGKTPGKYDYDDVDAARVWRPPAELSAGGQHLALRTQQQAWFPSWLGIREAFSEDLSAVWPMPFLVAQMKFLRATAVERERYLERTGVRFRVLPAGRSGGRVSLAAVAYSGDMGVFDFGESLSRAVVVPEAAVVAGYAQHLDILMSPSFDATKTVLLEQALAPAGRAGSPEAPSARIGVDTPDRVVIEASAGSQGGYLVLYDSYAADWQVSVDGEPAALGRANALFRAVHLAPGRHVVEHRFRPRAFFVGAAISGASLLVLCGLVVWGRRHPKTEPASL
jgi:hypothetical protein